MVDFVAERVVVELLGKTEHFDSNVEKSATKFSASVNKIEKASSAVEAVLENLRKKMQSALDSGNASQASSIAAQIKKIETAANEAGVALKRLGEGGGSGGDSITRQIATQERRFRLLRQTLGETAVSHNALALASGGTRSAMMELGHVARAAGDQIAAGTPLTTIFAQHIGQVGQAASLAGSRLGVLAAFFGGPWGIALTLATVVLTKFALGSKDAENSVDGLLKKMREQAEQARNSKKAQEEFDNSIEGVTAALDDQEEALNRAAIADKSAAFQAAVAAEGQRRKAIEVRKATVAILEQAEAQLEVLRIQAAQGGSLRDTGVNAEIAIVEQRLASLRSKVADANTQLQRAEQQAREFLSRAAVERGGESEIEGIRRKYDKLVEATRVRLVKEKAIASEIRKQTEALRAQQRIEEEAVRDRGKEPRLPKVTQAEVTALLKDVFGAATQITSTTRSAARNKLAGGAANSYHLTGQAIDFIPGKGLAAFDKEMLRIAAEARGIKALEILGPGDKGHADHGHIAFSRTRLGPDQVAEARERAARRAEQLAQAEERRHQAFDNEKANLEGQIIDARRALVESAEEIAKLELEAIEISRQKYADNLESLVDQKRLTQAEADELAKLNEERAKLRAELVQRREDQRKFRLQEAEAERRLQFQIGEKQVQEELLQSREGIATTAKARHDLERKLIDLSFQEERLQLQAVIAHAERLRIELERIKTLRALSDEEKAALQRAQDQAALAQQRLGTQGERQANAQTGNDRSNAGPLQDFFEQVPDTADEINQAFEDIAAGGLATFTDALTDAIVNFRSLGDVGRAVLQNITAALVKMAIQQLLLHTVGKLIGQTATAATTAEAGAAAAAWAPAAALASLATLGANAGPAAAAIAGITALTAGIAAASSVAGLGGFASGGYTGDGAVNSPAGIVHRREFVFDAPATARIGVANLEAMRRGVTPSNAKAASPRGGGATLSAEAVAQLGGIVTKAIEAMPDVALYPTLDPVDVIDAALSSPRGFQRFLVHLGDNRSAVTSTLQ